MRWSFHTIPQPGEPGYDTWPKDAWEYIGGANSWPGMTLDAKRGLVFVPTGSAAADFYGANRLGDNLYANCLLALDAATGKLRWHFQFVKHDVLDRDLPTAPTLVTLRVKGKKNRRAGTDHEAGICVRAESRYGKAGISGGGGASAGLGRSRRRDPPFLSTPDAARALRAPAADCERPHYANPRRQPAGRAEQFAQLRSDGPFLPLTLGTDTTIYPGFDGGAEWGGPAFDAESGLLYVNANEMAWLGSLAPNDTGRSSGKSIYLRDCAACHGERARDPRRSFRRSSDLRPA